MMNALDHVHRPALTLDERGNVLHWNQTCQALFDDWFMVQDGLLLTRDPRAQIELAKLFDLAGSQEDRTAFADLKIILYRGDRRPLIGSPRRLGPSLPEPFTHARVLVTFVDLEVRPTPAVDLLNRVFGLTAAEAKLAQMLVGGRDLALAAEELNIAKETARSRLKQIFLKTDTGRQSELVNLLSRLDAVS